MAGNSVAGQGPIGPAGPQGPQGIQGIQGIQGVAGLDGNTVLNGTVVPTTEGVNGDFFIRTDTSEIYGPKTGGVWGSPTSLIGPTGADGADGADGVSQAGLGVWRYRTELTTPPASGQLRFDNAVIDSATEMYLHETNDGGTDVSTFLDLISLGSLLYIQDQTDAANFVIIEVNTIVDSGTYRTITFTQIEAQGSSPGQNDEAIVFLAGSGSGGSSFPTYTFQADQFENPVNADWDLNNLAPAIPDPNNNALIVRAFDDGVDESVGFSIWIPVGATNMRLRVLSRGSGTAGDVSTNLRNRGITDNAAIPAWGTPVAYTDFVFPASTLYQYDEQTVPLTTFIPDLIADEFTQFEFVRDGGTMTGDWYLLAIQVSFT